MESVEANHVNFDSLRNMLLAERSQNSLERVKEDFFDQCTAFVSLQEGFLGESFSLEQARVVENSKKIIGELKDVRLRKILFKALKDFEGSSINSSGLAAGEKELYSSLVSLLSLYNKKEEKAQVKVRVLSDLPKIQAPDGMAYGPFSAGETVRLKQEIADLLLEKKIAEKA